MSSLSGITQPTSVLDYDPSVIRTISSPLDFPYDLSDLCLDSEFFFAPTINDILTKAQSNIETLVAYTKAYNTVIPKETIVASEYSPTIPNFKLYEGYEIQFDQTSISIYQDGVLFESLTGTEYGNFIDIRDVIVYEEVLYILDGNFLLSLDLVNNLDFITFIGGLGDNSSEYLFNDPIKIISDSTYNTLTVLQSNGYVKTYQNNTFISGRDFTESVLDLDILEGSYYALFETEVQITDSSENVTITQHQTESPEKIVLDRSQKGFFWLCNETSVEKYTLGGLQVGSYKSYTNLSSFSSCGHLTSTVSEDGVEINLDYSEVDDLLGIDLEFNVEELLVHCDELATDLVINDSLEKLYSNLQEVNDSILLSFEVEKDNEGNITGLNSTESSPIDIDINCNNYFGRDEFIACASWNRVMKSFTDLLTQVRNRLFGIDVFTEDGSGVDYSSEDVASLFNNTLGGQSGGELPPQLFNPSKTPISLVEITENPELESLLNN